MTARLTFRPLLALLSPAALTLAGCATSAPSAPASQAGDTSTSPQPSETPVPDLARLTDYDATQPLDLREDAPAASRDDGITVHDVSWISPGGGRVTAWQVVPPGPGPFAGLVYQHGSETDRDDFLDEAAAMAHAGATSLVVDAPFARTGPDRHAFLLNFGLAERERDMTAQSVVDLRRAFDVLVARPDVDRSRLGFVGHSWGAPVGAVMAAVDDRDIRLVLITGRPSWIGFLRDESESWVRDARDRVGEEDWQTYLALMAAFDTVSVIGQVDGGRLYLQYGTADDVVPEPVASELVDAVPGASVGWYDAGHALNDTATADRVAWLVEQLGLDAVPPEILATVGLPDE